MARICLFKSCLGFLLLVFSWASVYLISGMISQSSQSNAQQVSFSSLPHSGLRAPQGDGIDSLSSISICLLLLDPTCALRQLIIFNFNHWEISCSSPCTLLIFHVLSHRFEAPLFATPVTHQIESPVIMMYVGLVYMANHSSDGQRT